MPEKVMRWVSQGVGPLVLLPVKVSGGGTLRLPPVML